MFKLHCELNFKLKLTWKYLTVLTRNSSVASSSQIIIVFGCCCNALTVHIWFTPSSIALCNANDLCVPVTNIITSLASITVPTPTVSASFGTNDISLPKKRAFAANVSCVRVLTRVRDTKDEPGSLNAIWPSGPMPPINNSMPPAAIISASNATHSAVKSFALPFSIWTLAGLMSIWRKKFLHIK